MPWLKTWQVFFLVFTNKRSSSFSITCMSKTRLSPNYIPFISSTVPKKISPLCKNLALFTKLLYCFGLNFWVLTSRNKTAKKSNDPVTRILVRGLFNFIDPIEKEKSDSYLPQATLYLLFFDSKPWSRISFTRLVVQNLSNHLFTSSPLIKILNLNDVKSRFYNHFPEWPWQIC